MTVTSFDCNSCGANIPLSNLSNIAVCPYCNKDFYINEEWEESVKTVARNAERVLVNTIRDINIPEIPGSQFIKECSFRTNKIEIIFKYT